MKPDMDRNAKPAADILVKTKNGDSGLKTVVLWIYNINQNGTANFFHEEMSRYFDEDGSPRLRDMSPETLMELLSSITTAKEINLDELGIRLMLFIVNCNQNGSDNVAEVSCITESPES